MIPMRLLLSLCLVLLTQGLWASELRLHKDGSGGDWLELPDHQLWLPVQPGWTWQRQDRSGFLTLELRAPKGVAGIMLWGGDLGRRLEWRQLAQVWRERSAALGNLAELVDVPVQSVPTGVNGVEVQYQTWFGRVANQPSLTRVGYLVDAERAFVLMGIWLAGDGETARSINLQMEGLRLRRPEGLVDDRPRSATGPWGQAPDQKNADGPKGKRIGEDKTGQPLSQSLSQSLPQSLPRALPPPQQPETGTEQPAPALAETMLPKQPARPQMPEPQLPDPAMAATAQPRPKAEPQLRAPLPARPLIRHLRLNQGQTTAEAEPQPPLSRWQKRLDFSAQAYNLPPDASLEALWRVQKGATPEVYARQLLQPTSDRLEFHLDAPQGLFAAGDYRLELRLDDQILASLPYRLRDPSETELLTLATQGEAKAQLGIYAYLEMGRLARISETEALDWLKQAAAQGLPMAQYQLGLLYLEGRRGQPKDAAKAMEHFRAAAEQGLAEAAHALAMGYRQGLGLETDLKQAFDWSKEAAKLGHGPAAFFLGMHYLLGRGVEADQQEARRWLGKASGQGDTLAIEVLRELDALEQQPKAEAGLP